MKLRRNYYVPLALIALLAHTTPSPAHIPGSNAQQPVNNSVYRPTATTQSGDPATIVRKVKALYAETTTARVQFRQEGLGENVSGTLTYAQGNKFRLEFPRQTIASNGERTWTYLKERDQLVITKAAAGGQITPNDILTSFPGNYRTELAGETKVGNHSVWIIRSTPSSSGAIGDISEAMLYIDKKSYRFRQISIKSPSLGSATFRITSAQYNIAVPSSQFTITATNDTKVIDLTR